MEQLKQLDGRLLGKKCVATILGLLGFCSPSSLWAEKLDTTFVLDMVIDSTPCYYTKYGDKGNIVSSGRYTSSDYFRINVGYVTNENGERIDTLTYVCDPVTKQWRAQTLYDGYRDELYFHDNGMLKTIERGDPYKDGSTVYYSGHANFSEDGMLIEDLQSIERHEGGAEFSYNDDIKKYDTHGNLLSRYWGSSGVHHGGSSWSLGGTSNEDNYNNKYDAKDNLIEVECTNKTTKTRPEEHEGVPAEKTTSSTSYKMEYIYDSQNRRIKAITYYSDYTLKDSIVYTYGHTLREGEPCLLSIIVRGNPIDSFSPNKYQYDFSDNPSCYILDYQKDIKYITPVGSSVEELSYDSDTRQLTITVLGSGTSRDPSNMRTYTVKFSAPESHITSMTYNRNPVEAFSHDIYEYDFTDSTSFWFGKLDCTYSPGSIAEKSYDISTHILSIRVYGANFEQDSSNMNIYTVKFSAPESYITSMTNNGEIVEAFSHDRYEYDFLDSTSFGVWNLVYEFSPNSTVKKSYDDSTNTLSIRVYGADYEQDSSNMHTYSIRCKAPEAYLTSLSFNGTPVDSFSPTVFEYTLPDLYSPQERNISYTTFPGSRVSDIVNGTSLRITIMDELRRKKNVYVIYYSTSDACLTSLNINGNPVSDFSWDKYEYDFSDSLEYHEGDVSYTLQQLGVKVNGIYMQSEDWEILAKTSFDDTTGVLKIFVYYLYVGPGTQGTVDGETYVIKFKKPKQGSILTSLELDGEPVDSFSADKYMYDFSKYYYSSDISTKYTGGIILKKMSDDTSDTCYQQNKLIWTWSKYATTDVSYDEETGIFSIAVKGYDYAEDSSNIHVYKILTKKIDSLSIYSFQVDYQRGGWSNIVNVVANEHQYEAFSPLPTGMGYGQTLYSYDISANIPDVNLTSIQYSEATHTLTYAFSHKTIQSLVDTYYVVLQPCVISIYTNDNSACEAVDKFEHNIVGEYKPGIFKYELPSGVVATESYDDSTNILTLTARFKTGDTTAKTEYHIHFTHPSFSSLTINGELLDNLSTDIYDYYFDMEYIPGAISYTLPDDITSTESFDNSTNILTIRLTSSDAIGMVEYTLHFRPVDGVDDFLGDQVSLYVMDKTICVDGATEPIFVYDLRGTFVGTGRGEEIRIPVRQTGVYVVKAGRKAAKVVVK
ncbi:MAG: hypothetical protein IKP27_08990 [Paludibacteraceae bacterium]|nr:hypothetical protein [Paludibacteraceae bacterium]